MIETIQNFISNVENNSLIITLVSGGIIFTLFRYITDILTIVWNAIVSLISFEIVGRYNVDYEVPTTLKQIMGVLDNKSKVIWNKKVEFTKISTSDDDYRIKSMPHGLSIRILYGKIVIVNKSYDLNSMKLAVSLNIRVLFANKKRFLNRILNDIKNIKIKEDDNHININVIGCCDIEKQKRYINSIYTVDNCANKILNDVKLFIKNAELYKKCDIPYKRNYLLYGKPGTGKTSTIMSIASELDWDVVCIDMQDTRIETLMRNLALKKHTIFLFEDIDAMTKKPLQNRNKKEDRIYGVGDTVSEISLAQLLNITDGLMTPYGCVCMFTTNHIENLDEALLRDGRMDMKVEFKYFNPETSARMIKDKLGIDTTNIQIKDNMCPASLQENILQVLINQKSKEDFIKEIQQ